MDWQLQLCYWIHKHLVNLLLEDPDVNRDEKDIRVCFFCIFILIDLIIFSTPLSTYNYCASLITDPFIKFIYILNGSL